jgi:thiamine-phosphate pyrophosphorylase
VIHSFHDLAQQYDLKGIHLTKRHKKKRFAVAWRNFLLKLRRPYLTISTSCHDLAKLRLYANKYDYVMLSPVYNSISNNGGQAAYAQGSLKKVIKDIGVDKIVALGGLDATNIDDAKSLGFSGVALLGTLWYSNRKPIDVYNEAVDIEIGRTKPLVNNNPIKVTI